MKKQKKMKTMKFLAFAVMAVMAFTACSNEDELMDSSDDIVRINGSIDRINGLGTRVSLDGHGAGFFENGDNWGLYATVGATSKLTNSSYTFGQTPLYWSDLSQTAPVTFSAYYPRVSSVSDPEAFIFNTVTAAQPDLLLATPVTKSKGETVDMTFKHAMHRLVIGLTLGEGVTGSLLNAKITLLNMKSSAKINLLTGTVDAAGATGVDSYPMEEIAGTWYVAPQDLTPGTDWVKVEMDGKTYTLKVPASLKDDIADPNPTRLESGKYLTIQIKLKKDQTIDAVTVSNAISGWTAQVANKTIYLDATEN